LGQLGQDFGTWATWTFWDAFWDVILAGEVTRDIWDAVLTLAGQ